MAGALAALAAFDRLAPHIGNSPATAVQIAGLALISIPLATLVPLALAPAAFAGGLGVPIAFAPIALLAYLGVVTTAVAYALYYNGLRTTAGSTAAVLTLLEPLAAAGLAVLVLGEALPVPALVGGVLLLTAIGVLYLRPS